MFKRSIYFTLAQRLQEPRQLIQVVTGPRQVGKTTMVQQVIGDTAMHCIYASADEPSFRGPDWIEQQWTIARVQIKTKALPEMVLILDEIQKMPQWSESIKRLWDEDSKNKCPLKLVLLGSAPLLIQQGLTESLAGRFEPISATHWTWQEMNQAFGWTIEQYIYFGGYPGSAHLINDEVRWKRYINDALIETSISKDILLLNPIQKPALLRRLFELACFYSGQILSYQKMLGQWLDAGNTTTLAHYLNLLTSAGMVTGLQKFANQAVRQRGSSPKLQAFNTALISAQSGLSFAEATQDPAFWGRMVESAVGAYLINSARAEDFKIFYWRERGKEVDFIIQRGQKIIAIEVKSHFRQESLPGLSEFVHCFHPQSSLVIGGNNLSIDKFLSTPVSAWFLE